ncbi:MAG TPA: helix-turn-helix domain-containing protein, partial [Chloroflexia bacterium]|nr:helix-turn-helix domain-containing protein [Chloroflexia bacterium]
NRLHRVENRCSRWLLMVHTQAGRDNFMLTQEFLSQMLAVRRASVQSAASALQKAGLIEYRRGKLTIRDRAGLEKASCECYRIIQQEIENIFA